MDEKSWELIPSSHSVNNETNQDAVSAENLSNTCIDHESLESITKDDILSIDSQSIKCDSSKGSIENILLKTGDSSEE